MPEYVKYDDPDDDSHYNREFYMQESLKEFISFRFQIDVNKVYSALQKLDQDSKKINRLDAILKRYRIKETLTQYEALNIESRVSFSLEENLQPFWVGMLMALHGKKANPYNDCGLGFEGAGIAFETGIEQYEVYCTIDQWILDLKNGKKIELLFDTEAIIAKPIRLRTKLNEYGFSELPLVIVLTPNSLNRLFEQLQSKKAPFIIAMLNYLGFIKSFKMDYCDSEKDTVFFKKLGDLLSIDKRTVSGNFRSLSPGSKEDKKRYTAFAFMKTVAEIYDELKLGVLP